MIVLLQNIERNKTLKFGVCKRKKSLKIWIEIENNQYNKHLNMYFGGFCSTGPNRHVMKSQTTQKHKIFASNVKTS